MSLWLLPFLSSNKMGAVMVAHVVYLFTFNCLLAEVRNEYGFVILFPTGEAERINDWLRPVSICPQDNGGLRKGSC